MKLIDKNNFVPTVCVIYTILSVSKIVLEAFTQGKFGSDQGNLLTMLLFSWNNDSIPALQAVTASTASGSSATVWDSGSHSHTVYMGVRAFHRDTPRWLQGYAAFLYHSLCDRGACVLWRAVYGGKESKPIAATDEGGKEK